MDRGSSAGVVGRVLMGTFGTIAMLVVELIAAMLVYTYLNLYHLNTFGALVRFSKSVLDVLSGLLDKWFSGSSNAAYATLFGELGPKSILLLLIGLVVAALIRGLLWLMRGLAGRWD